MHRGAREHRWADAALARAALAVAPLTAVALVVGALTALVGCATPRTSRARVAVLSLRAVGVSPATARAVRRGISKAVARRARVVAEARVDAAAARHRTCQSMRPEARARCAKRVIARTGARYALVGALGRLGETHLLQLRLFDARRVLRTLERTLEGGGTNALAAAAEPLALGLLSRGADGHGISPLATTPDGVPRARRRRPWYRRAWIWVLGGVLVAAAAAAVAVPLILRDSGAVPDPYENIPLP